MSTTCPSNPEADALRASARFSFWGSLCRTPLLAGILAGMVAVTLLLAGWGALAANAQGDSPAPVGGEPEPGAAVSYEDCVAAATDALGPAEAASNAPSAAVTEARWDPHKSGSAPEAPEATEVEEIHPNSPAHDWCTADCDTDEQCERPTEFRIAEEPETETISISRAELEAGEAGKD